MPKTPLLATDLKSRGSRGRADDCTSVVFAVYAPFGSDETLSRYPRAVQAPVQDQALVQALLKVAATGVNVSALIDLFDDDSYLVEIPANQPQRISIVSAWKQDMSAPQALAGFLRRVQQRFPRSTLVLALEGHGGAFVPDLDLARITSDSTTHAGGGTPPRTVRWVQTDDGSTFEPDDDLPALPMASPILPMASPILPASHLPMSTWGLGAALRSAIRLGVPRPAVIHFANCFSASVELLHTVAPYADFATGYANYDFFTAGATYPAVFERLRLAGTASAGQLAQWFAAENGALLAAKKNHPSVGATVPLARMKAVAKAIDTLALALTAALQPADPTRRQDVRDRIQAAAKAAQHYDTERGFELAVPDQFMDIGSFAQQLQPLFAAEPVAGAAAAMQAAVADFWQYGAWDNPWLDATQTWDFRSTTLGLNIFFPDPGLDGCWDWRSPYYLSGKVDPTKPPAQRHVIDFLADRPGGSPPWVVFIVEYHREVDFVRFQPARAPLFPIFNARFKPQRPHPGDGRTRPGDDGKR